MNLARFVVLPALIGSTALGDPSPEAEAFLKVPDAVWSWNREAQVFDPADLPEELGKIVSSQLSPSGRPITKYHGYSLDLNDDKSPEYFLRSELGGSGGPHYFIYSKLAAGWASIGDLQGAFHLLKPENGWNPIIGTTRGGGDSFAKFRLELRGDRYDEIWIAHFDAGQIIPPQGLFPHRAWCEDARSPEERIQLLEGFWKEFLPACDGGSNPDRKEYEDAPHISHVRGTAYELALAYTSAGRKDKARRIIEWLRWSDQLELWNDQPNPLTPTPPAATE